MLIHKLDNVEIDLESGHKYAAKAIRQGENVIKYGQPIGHATQDIAVGEHVHTHNLKTNLGDAVEYTYQKKTYALPEQTQQTYFYGYRRENGDVGIRNEVWIVNTVGCVNKTAEILAKQTGAFCFPHPFGCSQLGEDHALTQKVLKGLVQHPNAAGVLVLGLGCENNHIGAFRQVLGEYNENRVKFLGCQDCEDEIGEGVKLIKELQAYADQFVRVPIPVSELRIGLKCGGSDGYSGITANPLVGRVTDRLITAGGACVLTEVPEMFGAEHLLMERAEDEDVFRNIVGLINGFKDYYTRHGQVIYENPSPGNKAGGITTLEEKSLGCIQKGGLSPVTDVLNIGDTVRKKGLSLLDGPGNDLVAVTNLAAAGAHMILFTTGRGTPLGAPVPTLKIASNRSLAERKKGWIDFDASPVLDGADLTDALFDLIVRIASGRECKNEINGYREISIFKDGVTL